MTRLLMMAVLLSAGSAYAADPATADRDFYAKAAAGGMAEVDTGALAQVKGHSGAVRDFGEMMVRDHTKANDKLKQIAGRKNIELPDRARRRAQGEEAGTGGGLRRGFRQRLHAGAGRGPRSDGISAQAAGRIRHGRRGEGLGTRSPAHRR